VVGMVLVILSAVWAAWGSASAGSRILRVTSSLPSWRWTVRLVVSNRHRSSFSGASDRLSAR
jgi:hypothetical protein